MPLKTFLPKPLVFRDFVQSGFGRGSKKLGFPTANLNGFEKDIDSHNLPNGVYFGYAKIGKETKLYKGVTNIGFSPTFKERPKEKIIEVHVIDRSKDLGEFYNQEMVLILLGFMRTEQKFQSIELLVDQIKSDIEITNQTLFEFEAKEEYKVLKEKLTKEDFLTFQYFHK